MRLCNETGILGFQIQKNTIEIGMFAREGYALIAGAIVLGMTLAWLGLWLDRSWSLGLFLLGFLIAAFTLYFFRDPDRKIPTDAEYLLLSPADGKVVVVDEVDETIFLNERAKLVSIFMSPLNVHVNRIPADGVIEFERYIPGEYLVAWHPKASEKNERSELGLVHPSGARVLFKQIAGAVARRIVYYVAEGDSVGAGDRFGIVKFGSRMDVLVPMDAEIDVQVGDRVRAGETVLGRLARRGPGLDDEED